MKNRKNIANIATSPNHQREPSIVGSIHQIPSCKIHPMPSSPFEIRQDASLSELVESIRQFGILVPTEVRPMKNGDYELIVGARRKYASDLVGYEYIPAIISLVGDDDAIIRMIDSNIQRENILPSERAKAYTMRLDAMKRKAGRPSGSGKENLPNNSANFRSDDFVGAQAGLSGDTIRNYISLTNLVPALIELVDNGKIGLTIAYQIAGLSHEEQFLLLDAIESEQDLPSLSQAQRIRNLSRAGKLNDDSMLEIMMVQKKPIKNEIIISADKLRKYFPRHYTPMQTEAAIFKLLDAWQESNSRARKK